MLMHMNLLILPPSLRNRLSLSQPRGTSHCYVLTLSFDTVDGRLESVRSQKASVDTWVSFSWRLTFQQ